MPKIHCDDGLRYRAQAKARGDYEAHQVGVYCNAYASYCDQGNSERASRTEAVLRMFVDTNLRLKEAVAAVGAKECSPKAKRYLRVTKKLGRYLSKDESKRLKELPL